ncbi:MAG TPA: GlsB/YeaQ/YmgE family stress response membrane protein [Candidatus Angelobacter sp.]|nr:GlsB/YeaQ/YmgE family stress response membrane protein [Candidatus Angelobacter sp.]
MHLLWWIVVGLIAGWITGKIMGGGHGVLMDILLGIAGAIVGGWLMRLVGFAGAGGTIYTIIVAVIGAMVLTWLVRLITRGRSSGTGTGTGSSRRVA